MKCDPLNLRHFLLKQLFFEKKNKKNYQQYNMMPNRDIGTQFN